MVATRLRSHYTMRYLVEDLSTAIGMYEILMSILQNLIRVAFESVHYLQKCLRMRSPGASVEALTPF